MLVYADWVRSVALVALLLCLAPATARGGNSVLLALDSPTDWEPESIVDWLEVSGRAGLLDFARHDIVIAIDLSDSALRDSGVDLDGDLERRSTSPATIETLGLGDGDGLLLRRLRLILDFDDTVLMTELAAARALIDQLRAIDKRRIRRVFGRLSDNELSSIDEGLRLFLGLDS